MIFTARQLQEKCREQHQDMFMALVYLSKAFDTVQRELLWDVLLRFGYPNKFVNILRQFHNGMTARVSIGGKESEPFLVRTGVRQGCVLAPVLFNIFLLCVTKLLHNEIENSSGIAEDFRLDGNLFNIRRLQATRKLFREHVLELQYADDCAFVAHTPEDLQTVLDVAVRAYSRMGLTVNTTKTEVVCQWSTNAPPTLPAFTVGNEQLLNIWGVFLLRTVASTMKFRAPLNRHQLPLGDFGVESFITRIFILPQKLPYTKRSVSPPSFIAVKLG